jgi:hypothetical protein
VRKADKESKAISIPATPAKIFNPIEEVAKTGTASMKLNTKC